MTKLVTISNYHFMWTGNQTCNLHLQLFWPSFMIYYWRVCYEFSKNNMKAYPTKATAYVFTPSHDRHGNKCRLPHKGLQCSEGMLHSYKVTSLQISRSLAKDTNERISILQEGKTVSKCCPLSKWKSRWCTQVFGLAGYVTSHRLAALEGTRQRIYVYFAVISLFWPKDMAHKRFSSYCVPCWKTSVITAICAQGNQNEKGDKQKKAWQTQLLKAPNHSSSQVGQVNTDIKPQSTPLYCLPS